MNALSATLPRLKALAAAFHDNLVKLRKQNPEACFGFISQGEAQPAIVAMLQGSEHTAYLQAQLTAVFDAIAEGRKQPRVYPQPRQADYDVLAADLAKRGWTPADMQLFSDERALAQAAPEKVCQMVHDWFAAQLQMRDPGSADAAAGGVPAPGDSGLSTHYPLSSVSAAQLSSSERRSSWKPQARYTPATSRT